MPLARPHLERCPTLCDTTFPFLPTCQRHPEISALPLSGATQSAPLCSTSPGLLRPPTSTTEPRWGAYSAAADTPPRRGLFVCSHGHTVRACCRTCHYLLPAPRRAAPGAVPAQRLGLPWPCPSSACCLEAPAAHGARPTPRARHGSAQAAVPVPPRPAPTASHRYHTAGTHPHRPQPTRQNTGAGGSAALRTRSACASCVRIGRAHRACACPPPNIIRATSHERT